MAATLPMPDLPIHGKRTQIPPQRPRQPAASKEEWRSTQHAKLTNFFGYTFFSCTFYEDVARCPHARCFSKRHWRCQLLFCEDVGHFNIPLYGRKVFPLKSLTTN